MSSALAFVPDSTSLKALSDAAQGCQGCDIYKGATQAVFGEGPKDARIMLIGEQPGDNEDKEGHPFVGPAGRMLDKALGDAGLSRKELFVTNAVKHFKWLQRGKRRLHDKPNRQEMRACKPWLDVELAAVKPRVVVCLGVTALHSVLGKAVSITSMRGHPVTLSEGPLCLATLHPSAVLRMPALVREAGFATLVTDLKHARELAASLAT